MNVQEQIAAAIKEERVRIARSGGIGRAKALTAKERKKIAEKASQAAAKARKNKAREKKKRDRE